MSSMGSQPPPYPGSPPAFPPVGSSLGPATAGPMSPPPVPAPPRGPGVRAPFLAPPKDRNNTRLAVTIVVGVLALAVCGVGSIFGLTGLFSWLDREMNDKAQSTVTAFLTDVSEGDYDTAYQQMCVEAHQQISPQAFASEWQVILPPGADFGLHRMTYDSDGLTYVPAVVDGGPMGKWTVDVYVVSEPAESEDEEAGMSVCGRITH